MSEIIGIIWIIGALWIFGATCWVTLLIVYALYRFCRGAPCKVLGHRWYHVPAMRQVVNDEEIPWPAMSWCNRCGKHAQGG